MRWLQTCRDTLILLDLQGCTGFDGLGTSASVGHLPALEEVRLAFTSVTAAGLGLFSDPDGSPRLKQLDVSACPRLFSANATANQRIFSALVRHCPRWTSLNLSRTNVPAEVVNAIAASARPPSRSALTLGLEGEPNPPLSFHPCPCSWACPWRESRPRSVPSDWSLSSLQAAAASRETRGCESGWCHRTTRRQNMRIVRSWACSRFWTCWDSA